MKSSVLFILLLFILYSCYGQKIKIDKKGALTERTSTSALSNGSQITLEMEFPSEFKDGMQKKISKFLQEKLDSVTVHLTDTHAVMLYSYRAFYGKLWTTAALDNLVEDLGKIRAYLDSKNDILSLHYLAPFYNRLKLFFETNDNDWYTVNNTTINSNLYQVKPGDKIEEDQAYQLEVRLNNLWNQLILELYKETYTNSRETDIVAIRSMTPVSFVNETRKLADINRRVKLLAAYSANTLNDSAETEMANIRKEYENTAIIKAVMNASFFKNWLWLREGELTLNPFELRHRDLNKQFDPATIFPALQNVSKLDSLRQTDIRFHRILLPQQRKDHRIVSFFQLKQNSSDEVTAVERPLKSTENVLAVVHNVAENESVELRLVKSVTHNGMNDIINGIGAALDSLGSAMILANTVSTAWGTLATILETEKSLVDEIDRKYPITLSLVPRLRREDSLWAALQADFKNLGIFNPHLFEKLKTLPAVRAQKLKSKIASRNASLIKEAIKNIVQQYVISYNTNIDTVNEFKIDSLVVSNIFRLMAESNPPPTAVMPKSDEGAWQFRTEYLYTGTTKANLEQEFAVKRFRKTGDKVDSVQVGSFAYKSSPRIKFAASIGPAFTIPNKYYSVTTVTAGEPLKISSRRDLVNFTIGLHIYLGKGLFTLDNSAFHSTGSPWHTRWSLYAGLGFPKTLENFYPGISFDVIAGIKVIGGAHCYLHESYKIANNVIIDKSKRFRAAGAFFSINIDPRIAVKAVGLIK